MQFASIESNFYSGHPTILTLLAGQSAKQSDQLKLFVELLIM